MTESTNVKTEVISMENFEEDKDEEEVTDTFSMLKIYMEEALENPLILYKIFHNLSFLELKVCRLVNDKWRTCSSEVMLRRDFCRIKMKYDSMENTYFRYHHKKVNGESDLAALNELLQNSGAAAGGGIFPCAHFAFYGKNLDGPDVDTFFETQGDKIKTLELGRTRTAPCIHRILHRQLLLPNMEKLILWSVKTELEIDYDDQQQQSLLPSLRNVSFVGGHDMAKKIIKLAPLQTIRLPQTNYTNYEVDLKLLIGAGKTHLLKHLVCYYATTPELLTQFSSANPKLTKLEFGDKKCVENYENKMELAHEFSNLIQATSHTLEYLSLGNLCAWYNIQIPKLNKLKTLSIGYFDSRCERCLPSHINLPVTFPNLQTLSCESLHCDEDDDFDSYFPPMYGTFSSVQNLQMPDNCTELWLSKMHQLCPNFKNLTIHSTIWLVEMMEKTFQLWQHLESLHIIKTAHVNYLYPGEYFVSYLDPVLTGFSDETCRQLLLASDTEVFDNLTRVSPSICDLKELKSFRISFKPEPDPQPGRFEPVPISHISGINAFKLMPDLKVIIEYDHNCDSATELNHSVFESVAPYVNIRHKCYAEDFWQD